MGEIDCGSGGDKVGMSNGRKGGKTGTEQLKKQKKRLHTQKKDYATENMWPIQP